MPIYFTWPTHHGKDRLHLELLLPHHQPPLPWGLSTETYIIRDGRGFRIPQAILEVQVGGFNLMVLTDSGSHAVPDILSFVPNLCQNTAYVLMY